MYNVSSKYIAALKAHFHQFVLAGSVGGHLIDDDNIITGSLSVVKQCSEGSEVKIGSVYIGVLKATLCGLEVPRNTWNGLTVELSEGLYYLDEGEPTTEYVPIGVFTIDSAEHLAKGVQITAYDNMSKLDKTFPANTIQGTAWSIYSVICEDCGVAKGMTQAQIQALPNGNMSLSMYTENDVETYRDVLSWLAQTLGCFAYTDREGRIRLGKYTTTVNEELGTVNRFQNSKFSDFITRYTGLSVVDIETQKTNYYSVEPDDGLTYNLGSNPFLQFGTDSIKNDMRRAILNALQAIQYTPFEIEWSSGAVFDLGDVIQFPGGRGANDIGCVMYSEWKYKKSTKLKGYGSNPALINARSKTDKDISGLMSRTDENGIQYYTYMNTDGIDVDDGESESITSIRFTTIETTKVTYNAEVLLEADTEDLIECTVVYRLNGSELRYKPVETWIDGKHILNLWYVIEVEPNTLYTWDVYLEADGGTVHIDAEDSRAAVWGQGLVAITDWKGYIDAEDTFTPISIDDSISLMPFYDDVEVDVSEPIVINASDRFEPISIDDNIELRPFSDHLYIDKTSLFFEGILWGDIKDDLWATVRDHHVW